MAAANPKPNEEAAVRRGTAIERAQDEQKALDELDAIRARQKELEDQLGITQSGQAQGPGPIRGQVQALLRERAGYVQRSRNPEEKDRMEDRISQVDEQLGIRGYRVGKDLEKDTAEAFEAAGPGVRVEDAITEREARQTVR